MAIDSRSDAGIYKYQPTEFQDPLDLQKKAQDLRTLASQQKMSELQQQHAMKQMDRDDIENRRKDEEYRNQSFGGSIEKLAGLPPEARQKALPSELDMHVKMGHMSQDEADQIKNAGESGFGLIAHSYFTSPQYLAAQRSKAELANAKNDPMDRELDRGIKRSTIAKNYAEAQKERAAGGGKPLAAEQSDKLAGHEASLHMIGDLRDTIAANKDNFGPIVGRFKSMNPYDPRGQEVSALFKKASQTIGKSLEGGKLTDSDYAKYQGMLPQQSDTPEVASAKLDQLERMVMNQRNSDIGTYKNAGLNVTNFAQTPLRDIEVVRPKGGSSGSVIPSANAEGSMSLPKPGTVEDGHVFIGGDPSSPQSWKRAK